MNFLTDYDYKKFSDIYLILLIKYLKKMKENSRNKEILRMQKLAGLLTENEYKQKTELLNEFLKGSFSVSPADIFSNTNYVIEMIVKADDGKTYTLKVKGPGQSHSSGYYCFLEDSNIPNFEKGDKLNLNFDLFRPNDKGLIINYTLMERRGENREIEYEISGVTEKIKINNKEVIFPPKDTFTPDGATNTGSEWYQAYSKAGKNPLAMFTDFSLLY